MEVLDNTTDANTPTDIPAVTVHTCTASDKITISHSCIQGCKSALLWHYQENDVTMESTLSTWCDDFIKGYKKTVADKKSRGVIVDFLYLLHISYFKENSIADFHS